MAKKITSFLLLVIGHIFLVSRLIFFPYPELFIYPYLTNLGLLPYSQMLDQHFPGLMFFPINLASLGFADPSSVFLLHVFIICAIHVLVMFISYKLIGDFWKSLVANIFLLLWHPYLEGNVLWIDSFIPLLYLPASYLFYKKNYKLSGLLIGLSLVVKQVVGPLAIVLSLYLLLTKKYKSFKEFVLWFILPPIVMILYFIKLGVFDKFIYWTVTYNLTIFSELGRKFITRNELIKFILIFSLSIFYSIYLLLKKSRLGVFSSFLILSLFFAYARFDFVHLQPALPFVAIIFAVFVSKLPKFIFSNFIILYILLASYLLTPYHKALRSDDVKFFGQNEYSVAAVIKKYAAKNDPIFAFGTLPHIYYLSDTRPSGDVFIMQFPWFMGVAENEILTGLVNEPPKVVIREKSATTSGMNLIESMPNINVYVEKNYSLVDKIGEVEIMIPNEDSN